MHRRPSSAGIVIAGLVLLYLTLAFAMALTKRPWVDEAWFAIPALNLLTHGFMGTTNIETTGTWLTGIDQYTYWITPLHLVTQSAWYAVFGFGVVSLRSLSIVWGLVAVLSWFVIVRRLTSSDGAAILTVALIGTDYLFIRGAGDGRMDVMASALAWAAVAAYLTLRTRAFVTALVVGHSLAAAAALTHPGGAIGWAALIALTLFLDRSVVRARHAAIAAVPYLLGLAAWGLYIARAPEYFLIQFGGNAADRPWEGLFTWVRTLGDAYSAAFGLSAHWAGPVVHVRALVLLAYAVGVIGLFATPGLRARRGTHALLLLVAVYFLLLPWFRSPNAHDYLVHILPAYAAALAVSLTWWWNSRMLPRPLLATATAGLMLLQTGGVALRAYTNTWSRNYTPVVTFLDAQSGPDDLIIGSAELGFALGFTPRLVDDPRLGYHSHRHAEFIVIDDRYADWLEGFPAKEPEVAAHVARLMPQYEQIYARDTFTVYRCRLYAVAAHTARASITASATGAIAPQR